MKIRRYNGSNWVQEYPEVNVGAIAVSNPNNASSSTFLRGDGAWAVPSAGTNNYLTGVSGSGDGTVTFTRQGLSNLTWDASHSHSEYLPLTGGTLTGTLTTRAIAMQNYDITGINALAFNDPGPNEGISWNGGNFKIYESPNDLTTNSSGNLQFVSGGTRRMTVESNGNVYIGGGLTIDGSINTGAYEGASEYEAAGTNLRLKGDSSGRSGIFFQSEKDGTNINHTSDFGFIQFHPYGRDGTSGEANELIIGVSNDSTDHLIFNTPTSTGIKARVGASATEYTMWHGGNDGASSGLDADLLDGQHGSYYAPLASPALTGTPTAPTPAAGDDDTSIATTAFVQDAIESLVNGASASFDTLKEIQDAMATDTELANAIAALTIGNGTQTITAGSGLSGGGSFTANQTGNTSVTVSHADTSSQASVNNSGRTYIQDITLDTYGHITGITSATETVTDTVYTHPTHPGDDISIDTGALTGATVISDLDFNVTSDTLGHITDANATVSTRNLTASDIGAASSSHNHSASEIVTGEMNTARLGSGTATSGYVLKSDGDGTASWQQDNNTTYTLGSFGVTATAAELNKMDGVTATTTELNYTDGVTSNIQTQLNGKASTSHTHAYVSDAGDTMTGDLTMDHDGESTENDSHGINFTARFLNTDFAYKLYMDSAANLKFGTNTIFHSGNDGSSSGLHADLLDGQQGSYYLDYNNLTNTPTDNDTITQIRRDNTGTYRTGNINLVGGTGVTITETASGVFSFAAAGGGATYSSNALYIKRIWSASQTSDEYTLRYNAGTGSGTSVNTTSTWTSIALGYTPSSTDKFMIELSNSTSNSVEKGIAWVGHGTFSSTAGMAVISYDAYETVTSGQLKLAKYFCQYQISGSNMNFRYASKVVY